MIYPNLGAEMTRKGITQLDLACQLGRSPSNVCLKLNGKAKLELDEAFAIRNFLKSPLTIDVLFAKDSVY